MASLLHLDSSANRGDASVTRRLSALFADTWRSRHGSALYARRDLVADPVPPIDTPYCTLGRRVERRGLAPLGDVLDLAESTAERREWHLTLPLVEQLLAADTVVIGAPMYNYSIAAALKAWIDRVSFPGAFLDSTTGASRLARTRVVVITACGGTYGAGTPREALDFATPYLRAYFGKQGVPAENVRFVVAERTLASLVPRFAHLADAAAASLAAAEREVVELAVDVNNPTRRST